MKKLLSFVFSLFLLACLSAPTFAIDGDFSNGSIEGSEVMDTPSITINDEGELAIRGDIYQQITETETDSGKERLKYYIAVGTYEFNLRFLLENGLADVDWYINLTNGDYIKGVNGTFILKEDYFGPYNPEIDTVEVDEYYFNTRPGEKHSREAFSLIGADLTNDSAVIFQWEDFEITGGADDYVIRDNEQQGKVSEFPL